MIDVVPIPAFADNYIFGLLLPEPGSTVLVDPGEPLPALEFLERERRELEAILITHHHRDHVGGVADIVRRFPEVRVIAAASDRARIPQATEWVGEDDDVRVLGHGARVLDVSGHTRGHLAYFIPEGATGGDLFSGDTVFGGTIGNLFEGTPDDMFSSLQKIRALPAGTRLWCGHEYTLQYVREAARFDPGNVRLNDRLRRLEAAPGRPTVPLLLKEERATNPFFRWDDPEIVERLGTPPGLATFRRLCELL